MFGIVSKKSLHKEIEILAAAVDKAQCEAVVANRKLELQTKQTLELSRGNDALTELAAWRRNKLLENDLPTSAEDEKHRKDGTIGYEQEVVASELATRAEYESIRAGVELAVSELSASGADTSDMKDWLNRIN